MSEAPLSPPDRSFTLPRLIAGLLTIVFLAVLVRTAWIGDDAMISFRTVLNVTHGFGLRFNVAERVQTFTHPLWLLLITATYAAVGNVFHAAYALSFATSAVAFWIAIRRAVSVPQAWLVAGILLFSRAFVDYSTSGLENPLAHLLLAWLAIAAIRHDRDRTHGLATLWLVSSLLYLTRPDLVLFAMPLVTMASLDARPRPRAARAALVGLVPAALWTLFSLVYYGFPFPNTAYAKLGTGISRGSLWDQGLLYLIDSIDKDPLTLVVIAFATVTGVTTRHPVARRLAFALVLYVVYVVSIGGDFMGGRFLSAPLFVAALVVGWLARPQKTVWISAGAVCALVATASTHIPLYSNSRFDDAALRSTGITDERGVFFKQTSLVGATRLTFRSAGWPENQGSIPNPEVIQLCGLLGESGLSYGPYVYLLDECALADPLLARMPSLFNDDWRIGHFRRMLPEGYEDSLATNQNTLRDPQLRAYYDAIRQITRETALFSPDRLRTILRANTGRFDALVNTRYYRYNGQLEGLRAFSHLTADGTPIDTPGIHALTGPLAIMCEDVAGRRYIDASVDSNDDYKLTFIKGRAVIASMEIGKVPEHRRKPGLASHPLDLPPEATRLGFDTIVVEPISGDERYAIGHLLIEGVAETDTMLYAQRRRFNEPIAPR